MINIDKPANRFKEGVLPGMASRPFSLLWAICCLWLTSASAQSQKAAYIDSCHLDPFPIRIELVLENIASNYWEISWDDPFGGEANFQIGGRELHCIIRDSSGIVGFYQGLSTSMSFAGFYPKEDQVEVEFKVSDGRLDYFKQCAYAPLSLTLDRFYKDSLILLGEKDNVRIRCNTYFPELAPMSEVGDHRQYYRLNQYYLSRKKRKVLTGRQWFNRYSICKIYDELALIRIDPDLHYPNRRGEKVLGKRLIEMKKLPEEEFDLGLREFRQEDKLSYGDK